jgi:hypothetical protein
MLLLFSEGKVPGRYILFCWPILRETYPVLGPYILFYCLILTGKSGGGIFYDCTTVRILCFFGWKSPWVVYLVPIPLLGDGTFFWRKLFFSGRYMIFCCPILRGKCWDGTFYTMAVFGEKSPFYCSRGVQLYCCSILREKSGSGYFLMLLFLRGVCGWCFL